MLVGARGVAQCRQPLGVALAQRVTCVVDRVGGCRRRRRRGARERTAEQSHHATGTQAAGNGRTHGHRTTTRQHAAAPTQAPMQRPLATRERPKSATHRARPHCNAAVAARHVNSRACGSFSLGARCDTAPRRRGSRARPAPHEPTPRRLGWRTRARHRPERHRVDRQCIGADAARHRCEVGVGDAEGAKQERPAAGAQRLAPHRPAARCRSLRTAGLLVQHALADLGQRRLDVLRAMAAQRRKPECISAHRLRARARCRGSRGHSGAGGSARPGTRRSPACPRPPSRRRPAPARGRSARPASMRCLKLRAGFEGVEAHHHLLERDAELAHQHPRPHRPRRVVLVADEQLHGGAPRLEARIVVRNARPSDERSASLRCAQRIGWWSAPQAVAARILSPSAWRVRAASGRTQSTKCASRAVAEPAAARSGSRLAAGHAVASFEQLDQFAALEQVVHQRQARQRDALARQRALHLLVREVQEHPAQRLQPAAAVLVEPTAPTQRVGVDRPWIVFLEQRVQCEIGRPVRGWCGAGA